MNSFYFKKQNPTDMDSSFGCAYFIVRNFDIKRVDKSHDFHRISDHKEDASSVDPSSYAMTQG